MPIDDIISALQLIRNHSCPKIDAWIKDESDAVIMYKQLASFYAPYLPEVAETFRQIAIQEQAHHDFLVKLKESLKCEQLKQ